ncbi:uncharacterized protein LOC144655582 isoform X3 [Oculina patagonica]
MKLLVFFLIVVLMEKKVKGAAYETLGCFKDTSNRAIPTLEGKDNLLNGQYQSRSDAIKKCYNAAKKRGFKIFALQNGGWCASSDEAEKTFNKYGKSGNCHKNGKGGPWANQVYYIEDYKSVGCYKDTGNRAIPTIEGKDSILDGPYRNRQNAITKCAVAARKMGFHMFAVQHGGWCATSATAEKTFDKYGKSNDCKDDGEGGPWANDVYVIQDYKSVGCYKDTGNRAIPTIEGKDSILDGPYRNRQNAVAKCAVAARKMGFHMFAIQHGGWCATSATAEKTFDKYGKSNDCKDDGEGGPWANDVYVIQDYKSVGCYKDTGNRAIPTIEGKDSILDGSYGSRQNAIAKCAVAARKRGFHMFAVQNGGWCATSATAEMTFDKYGKSNDCKDDGEGGPWANEVYVIQDYKSVGCYKDTGNRAIPTIEGKDSILDGPYRNRQNAVAKCAVAARKMGFHMFAIQHGGWCATSATAEKTFDKYGKSNDCKDDGEGGPWANDVYVIQDYKSVGCYKDTGNRAIPTIEGKDSILDGSYGSRQNAIAKCAVAARERGFHMFAVQNGGWCATSATAEKTFDKYGKSNNCKDDGEGGPWGNDVYVIQDYKSLGCYKDTGNRAIPTIEGKDSILDGSYGSRQNAIAKCAVAARRRGFHTFAVQNGGWCATSATADNTFDKYGKSNNCKDDGEGGPWANEVYTFEGSCKYASCSLGSWSSWADMASPVNNHCASQQRTRSYALTWLYTQRESNCNGIGPQSCPASQSETREKVVTCPALSNPAHGSWDRDDCRANAQVCRSVCLLNCDVVNGFQLEGPGRRECLASGQWSTPWSSYCKDVRPPTITCPKAISVPTDPGKPTAKVCIPRATATDNTGQPPSITNDVGADSKDFAVSSVPHQVKYTATDAAGLTATCTLQITVSDKERPRVASCPKDIKKQTNQNEIRVTWDYPVFEDNVDKPPAHQLRISSNKNPGVLFPWGRVQVVYEASDSAGNKATCEFMVEVGPVACTYFDPPAYGIRACNKKTLNSNNVTYEMVCVIQCKDGYAFADQAAPNTYMCQSDGTWNKLLFGAALVPVFPKSQRPWPDCAPEQNVNAAKKNFTFYTGSCSENEQEALARIRQNFLAAVVNSPLANYALCTVSQGQDCIVENVKVYCGANSRRRRNVDFDDSSERVITFDFVINDKNASSDPKVEAAKLLKMMQDLDTLEKFIKENFPQDANMPGLTVSAAGSSAACPVGKVVVVVPGNNSELERTICVECPAGTYYNTDSQTCENCQDGTFQNRTGQSSCDPCPAGTWTVGGHAKNFTECFEICEPGEYTMQEESGVINCLMCPIGTYQPKFRATKCEACPPGTTTAQKASTSINNCQ